MSDPKPVMGQQLKPFDVMRAILQRENDRKNGVAHAVTPEGTRIKIVPNADAEVKYRRVRLPIHDTQIVDSNRVVSQISFFTRYSYEFQHSCDSKRYQIDSNYNDLLSGEIATWRQYEFSTISLKADPVPSFQGNVFFAFGGISFNFPFELMILNPVFVVSQTPIVAPNHWIPDAHINFGYNNVKFEVKTRFSFTIDGFAEMPF